MYHVVYRNRKCKYRPEFLLTVVVAIFTEEDAAIKFCEFLEEMTPHEYWIDQAPLDPDGQEDFEGMDV